MMGMFINTWTGGTVIPNWGKVVNPPALGVLRYTIMVVSLCRDIWISQICWIFRDAQIYHNVCQLAFKVFEYFEYFMWMIYNCWIFELFQIHCVSIWIISNILNMICEYSNYFEFGILDIFCVNIKTFIILNIICESLEYLENIKKWIFEFFVNNTYLPHFGSAAPQLHLFCKNHLK